MVVIVVALVVVVVPQGVLKHKVSTSCCLGKDAAAL